MSTKTKHFGLLILGQAGCLAVGLWMQQRFTVSAAAQNAEDDAWSALEARAAEVASAVEGGRLILSVEPAAIREEITDRVSANGSGFGDVLVLDAGGKLVWSAHRQHEGENTEAWASLGDSVLRNWRADETGGRPAPAAQRGRLALGGVAYLAVLRSLPGGLRLVIHESSGAIEASLAATTRSLPAIGSLTFIWTIALLSIVGYTILSRVHDEMEHERLQSATDTLRQTQNLVRTRDAVIFGLAKLADSRDPETGDHLERISVYSTTLASALRRDPRYREEVTPAFVRLIGISSALHDIGKVGVADSILRKAGPLTADEREAMQIHTAIGGRCLSELEQRLGGSNFLQMAREIAYAHHENWDGTGYPNGLSGTQIPLAARIVAIADVYDALSSRRVYKDPMAHRKCVEIIRRKGGTKFDPDLIEVWLTIESKFESVARQFAYRAGEELLDDQLVIASPEYRDESESLCAIGSSVTGVG